LAYDQAFADVNRTMCVSYIGESEFKDLPR